MHKCPFCGLELAKKTSSGWLCECGETVPCGFELDENENYDASHITCCKMKKGRLTRQN